ncbi:MAG: pantetheine-phosphate adenylyltransferase [Leptospiraceae bacterium]|nr:pantetheine-phosphate adenylyltransferase [Leptospiraceae bacterium]MCB1199367.1 pantetheine-phosphate adenylyltransferase [Leptospiraceae bacterium]
MQRKAVYPGSFDPFTNGHLDIVRRSLQVVDRVVVAILKNTSKQSMFSPEQRKEVIEEVFANEPRVEVKVFSGLLVEFCRQNEVSIIIRGLRAVSDFDYEHAIFLMNRSLKPGLETMFLMSDTEHSFISSSIIREVASLGGEIEKHVPQIVARKLRDRFQNQDK